MNKNALNEMIDFALLLNGCHINIIPVTIKITDKIIHLDVCSLKKIIPTNNAPSVVNAVRNTIASPLSKYNNEITMACDVNADEIPLKIIIIHCDRLNNDISGKIEKNCFLNPNCTYKVYIKYSYQTTTKNYKQSISILCTCTRTIC